MVTIIKTIKGENGKGLVEAVCLSTDEKPEGLMNGSLIMEMDTGKFYVYDEDGTEWIEFGGSSSDPASDDDIEPEA